MSYEKEAKDVLCQLCNRMIPRKNLKKCKHEKKLSQILKNVHAGNKSVRLSLLL